MNKITLSLVILLLVSGSFAIAAEVVKVPFSAIKPSCYGDIDMSKAEFGLSEVGRECVTEKWLEENEPEEDSSKQECKGMTAVTEDNTIIYQGDFVLEEGEEKTFKDKNITIRGDLVIKPNSRLKLKNSCLKVRLEFKGQRSIWVLDKSSLELINSEVKPIGKELPAVQRERVLRTPLMLEVLGGELRVKDSEASVRIGTGHGAKINIDSSQVAYIYWRARDRVKIEDSILGSFVFDLRDDTEPGNLALKGLKSNRSVDFELETVENGKLSLVNTSIRMGWQINLEFTPKDVTVENSNLQHIWLKLPPTEKQAKINLKRGHLQDFNLKRHITDLGLPFSLNLVDTRIDYFKIEPFGTNAVIEDTSAMIHPYEGSALTLSETNALNPFFIYGADVLRIVDSKISGELRFLNKPEFQNGYEIAGYKVGPGGEGKVIFDNSIIDVNRIVVACKKYNVEGEVKIKRPFSLHAIQWTKGSIKRSYPVVVLDQNEEPLPNVTVALYGNSDNLVTKKTTNRKGRTTFNIDFNEKNYKGKWKMTTEMGAVKKTTEVDFLSSSPIIFELKRTSP